MLVPRRARSTRADLSDADLTGLRRAAEEVERPARLGPLEITAMPPAPVDAAGADRNAELGGARLVIRPEAWDAEAWDPAAFGDTDELARFLERHAGLGGAAAVP